ncbi:hypothetical protein BN1051_01260 [Arthrobacter saudimassiliensis]|uniref:Uncharacterized protein n=1 Tax=Arthrobacter saudimassiliensis TaxID=1461584 RepID=A0A078MNT2_9MICC|nr:hypothetical protein BN1051_01260 [Arthrobacter saudimassiliensis]
MARRSLLDRFRPVGAPGPAGPAAVPAEDRPGPEAELGPVFAALQPDVDAAARRIDEARRAADRHLAAARTQAAGILEGSRQAAAAARAAAAAEAAEAVEAADARRLAEARRRAGRLRERGRSRLGPTAAALLDRMVERMEAGMPRDEPAGDGSA